MPSRKPVEPRTPVDPMDYTCEVCDAKPGEICVNTVQVNKPLPGRDSHHGRAER